MYVEKGFLLGSPGLNDLDLILDLIATWWPVIALIAHLVKILRVEAK